MVPSESVWVRYIYMLEHHWFAEVNGINARWRNLEGGEFMNMSPEEVAVWEKVHARSARASYD